MNNICFHPWVGLEVNPQQEFKPCCLYQKSLADNLPDYQNSKELAELKQSFLNGEYPVGCKTCWDREQAGLPSKRITDWKYVYNEESPGLDTLKVLMFDFGNACNLACRTCSSKYSSTWINEEQKLLEHFPSIKIHKHQKFYQDKIFMDQIKDACTGLVRLQILGGEPFIAGFDEHLDLLEFLVKHNAKNIDLHYTTNGTIFPRKEFWELWKNFKSLHIQLSIDGIESQFEYMRWPAKWEQISESIQLYRKQSLPHKLTIAYTVSAINVYYFPEFYKWILQNNFKDPFINILDVPKLYNIKVFPKSIKDKIAEKLLKYHFTEIVSYMYAEDYSEQFDDTIKIIRLVDQQRNQSFNESYPEFNQILQEAGCQI